MPVPARRVPISACNPASHRHRAELATAWGLVLPIAPATTRFGRIAVLLYPSRSAIRAPISASTTLTPRSVVRLRMALSTTTGAVRFVDFPPAAFNASTKPCGNLRMKALRVGEQTLWFVGRRRRRVWGSCVRVHVLRLHDAPEGR